MRTLRAMRTDAASVRLSMYAKSKAEKEIVIFYLKIKINIKSNEKSFICLDENIILSCRTCRHGLGGNCFKMLKKCPFCRADFKKKIFKYHIEVFLKYQTVCILWVN